MIVTCEQCGKQIERVPAKIMAHIYCGRHCAGLARRGRSFMTDEGKQRVRECFTGRPNPALARMSREQTGERHPRWVGDDGIGQTGHHRAQRAFDIQPCEVCGVSPTVKRIHRHHKDRNTLNNSSENIAFLCTKHHRAAHKAIRDAQKGGLLCALSSA